VSESRCAHCGRELSDRDRHVRFGLPDAVFARPEAERHAAWMMPTDKPDLLAFERKRFVRALLPVHLDDGASVTFGTWLEVALAEFNHAVEVWMDDNAYGDLVVDGQIANAVPPWRDEVMGRSCTARVLVDDQIPYVIASTDALVARILTGSWPASTIVASLP
jgi:hypothetical protein